LNIGNRNEPSLSIVICTFNRAELLKKTLGSLPSLTDIESAEVIVVDNNSADHTRCVAMEFATACQGKFDVRYVFESRQGLSAARNAGAAAARGDIVAFLDDDAVPVRGWIRSIATAFGGGGRVHAMGGIVRPHFEGGRPEWLIKPMELPYTIVHLGDAPIRYPANRHPCGANMAVRRRILLEFPFPESLGRRGESLLSGEETWLFERMRERRMTIVYHPGMAVTHFIPAARLTREWIKRRYYCQGASNGLAFLSRGQRWKAFGSAALRSAYVAVDSLFARSEGRKLLNECRRASIRGLLDQVRERGRVPAAG